MCAGERVASSNEIHEKRSLGKDSRFLRLRTSSYERKYSINLREAIAAVFRQAHNSENASKKNEENEVKMALQS